MYEISDENGPIVRLVDRMSEIWPSRPRKYADPIISSAHVTADELAGTDYYSRWVTYPNGYGASIQRHDGSYGAEDGLFELAVIRDGGLCYDSPITDDVLGHLTAEGVLDLLDQIMQLGEGDMVTDSDGKHLRGPQP